MSERTRESASYADGSHVTKGTGGDTARPEESVLATLCHTINQLVGAVDSLRTSFWSHPINLTGASLKDGKGEDWPPLGKSCASGPQGSSGPRYSEILQRATGDQEPVKNGENLMDRARRKLSAIKANRNAKKPICYRCGDAGHRAEMCCNKMVCFACQKVGHRSWECRAALKESGMAPITSTPSSTINPPLPKLISEPNRREKPDLETSRREIIDLDPETMLPVEKFNDSPATQELEAAFRRSVVVYDVEGWGRERILADLRAQVNFRWRVSELPSGTMLVEGPVWWKEKVLREEMAVIEDRQLRVEPWDPAMDAGNRLKSVWIRVIGFPMKLWSRFEFERLVDEFGVLLEIDVATKERLSFTEAKIRIGVCKYEKIPRERDIEFRNERGEWVWRTVQFIIDTPINWEKHANKRKRIWIRKPDQGGRKDEAGPSAPAKDKQPIEEDGDEYGDEDEDLMDGEYDEEIQMEDEPFSSQIGTVQLGTDASQSGTDKRENDGAGTDTSPMSHDSHGVTTILPLSTTVQQKGVTSEECEEINNNVEKQLVVYQQPSDEMGIGNKEHHLVGKSIAMVGTTRQSLRQKLRNPAQPVQEKAIQRSKEKNLEAPMQGDKLAALHPSFWGDDQKLTDMENYKLIEPFNLEEIKQALFESAAEKTPGPDDTQMMQVLKWIFIGFEAISGLWKASLKEEVWSVWSEEGEALLEDVRASMEERARGPMVIYAA